MIRPPTPRAIRALALLVLVCAVPLLFGASDREARFGMAAERYASILAGTDPSPILSLDPGLLDRPGAASPADYYYLALWLEKRLPPAPPRSPGAAGRSAPATVGETEEPVAESLPNALGELGVPLERKPPLPPDPLAAPEARVLDLLRLAFQRGTGLLRREAGLALVERLAARAEAGGRTEDREALLAASSDFLALLGPEEAVRSARLPALEALGRDAELLREASEPLAPSAPPEAVEARLWYQASASVRLGRREAPLLLRSLLLERPASAWTDRAIALAASLDPRPAELQGEVLDAARLRALVRAKDYAAAYRAALRAPTLALSARADPALLADAGKAFLYSSSAREGLALFGRIAEEARALAASPARGAEAPAAGGRAELAERSAADAAARARAARAWWTASFYRGRFLRALDRHEEAAGALAALVDAAPDPVEADAALWYATDSRILLAPALAAAKSPGKGAAADARRAAEARRISLDALRDASRRWTRAAAFSDLADTLLRGILAARDWDLVREFARSPGPALPPVLASRSLYLAGRVEALGLAGSAPDPAAAAAFFRAVPGLGESSSYYAILAERMLGGEPGPGALAGAVAGAEVPVPSAPAARPAGAEGELVELVLGFLPYGLGERAWARAKAGLAGLSPDAIRGLAEAFREAGYHSDSMRLVLAGMDRPDWEPRVRDFELAYPRPFLDELRGLKPAPAVPEHVLFALVRSESFFRPEVVSRAGAVGLSQLMPATAEEVARKIRLSPYDLRDPADNLRIGSSFFGDLLRENGGHPLRAMFAYNAGRGRLRRWLAESGDLPDDLLLESLGIEETRQYGRNILQAAVFYGKLYYGKSAAGTVDELLGEPRG